MGMLMMLIVHMCVGVQERLVVVPMFVFFRQMQSNSDRHETECPPEPLPRLLTQYHQCQ